ncbi:MAG TPA: hypothetical protein VGC64_04380, partial [Pyrinomonadaceae bacterium]
LLFMLALLLDNPESDERNSEPHPAGLSATAVPDFNPPNKPDIDRSAAGARSAVHHKRTILFA